MVLFRSTTISNLVTEPDRSTSLWLKYHGVKDTRSEDDLVKQYLPLLKTVVGRLALTLPSHLEIEDFFSVGAIGLLHAIRNFDPSKGTSFETYARFRIRGAVLDELRKSDWASRTIRDKTRKIQTAMINLEQQNGAAPSEREMAAELGISRVEYQQWIEEVRPTTFVCLDSTTSNSDVEGRELAEIICDPAQDSPLEILARRELAELIGDRIRKLPEIQRKVLALYYVEDLRLREIAEAFGVTESRICQVHAQAILSIRSYLKINKLGYEAQTRV